MASKENTGLHAALIIFVMITVVLGISTYMGNRAQLEAESKWLAAEAAKKDMLLKSKDKDEEIKVLRWMLGWNPDVPKDEIDGSAAGLKSSPTLQKAYEAYKQDMAKWAEGITNPNYRNIYEPLVEAIKAKSEQTVAAVADQRKSEAQVDAVTTRESAATKQHDEAAKKAVADLETERGKFQAERTRLNQEKEKLQKEKEEFGTRLNKETDDLKKQIALLEKQITDKEKLISFQKEEIKRTVEVENFEVPDGKITSVNQRTNTVFIDLGSADGLRNQVSFSVYDRSENNATKAKKKGGIEVIKIIDDHTAECRITKDSLNDLILPGDQIYSPVWNRGPRLRFALTGWLDIDGDGENDRSLVRSLIEMNGGIVDLEQTDDGVADPKKITFQTRYLVDTHEFPERVAEKIRQNRNNLLLRAKDIGTQVIHVNTLLGYMGWKGSDKTTRLGSGGAATDPKKKDSEFKNRQPAPPAAKKNDAF